MLARQGAVGDPRSRRQPHSRRRCHASAPSQAPTPPPPPPGRRARLRASGSSVHQAGSLLPLFGDFLRSEAGHAAVLQLSDWRHERLAAGRYLCFAPRATLLGWTVAPALELEVVSSPGASSAAVHLLRTTLAGSQAVEAQSRRLHAVGLHTISWTEGAGAPVLRSAVELTVDLAVEGPLALFSGAAIAAPGSLFLRRVIRRSLVESKFLASLETAYREWERAAAPGTSDV